MKVTIAHVSDTTLSFIYAETFLAETLSILNTF